MKGANYLSGGQTLKQAVARLNAINICKSTGPWNLSFSWSQALQLPLLALCKGKGELQLEAMTKLFLEELEIASAAARGLWKGPDSDGDHRPPVLGKRQREN